MYLPIQASTARVSRYIHTDVCETRQHCRDSREERTLVVAVPMRILSKLWLPAHAQEKHNYPTLDLYRKLWSETLIIPAREESSQNGRFSFLSVQASAFPFV